MGRVSRASGSPVEYSGAADGTLSQLPIAIYRTSEGEAGDAEPEDDEGEWDDESEY